PVICTRDREDARERPEDTAKGEDGDDAGRDERCAATFGAARAHCTPPSFCCVGSKRRAMPLPPIQIPEPFAQTAKNGSVTGRPVMHIAVVDHIEPFQWMRRP